MADQKSTSKADDAGQAEAQKRSDEATEKGYIGQKADPLPNSEHSLESGPDSPQQIPDDRTRAPQVQVGEEK